MAGNFSEIHALFIRMLVDGKHSFDAARSSLLGATEAEAVRADLFATDRRINETEQELRRQIVIHGSVHGVASFPSLLVLMSLGKDAERIGDYAKNMLELAIHGFDAGDEQAELTQLSDLTSELLERAREIHTTEDADAARAFLADADRLEGRCDRSVARLLSIEGVNMAGRALAYRYLKRVASHAANVVTALVVPLHKLDFFDEE